MPSIIKREGRSAGSTGTKADIDIESPQFSALSDLGNRVSHDQDRKLHTAARLQRHVDEGSIAAYSADNRLFQRQLDSDINSPDLIGNKEGQSKLLENSFTFRREALESDLKKRGASGGQSERLLKDLDDLQELFNVSLKTKHIKDDAELANNDKIRAATGAVEDGNIDEAFGILDSLQDSQDTINSLKSAATNKYHIGIQEGLETGLALSETREDVEEIEIQIKKSPLPVASKERTQQKAIARKRTLFNVAERTSMEQYEINAQTAETEGGISDLVDFSNKDKSLGDTARIRTQQMLERRRLAIYSADTSNMKAVLSQAKKEFNMILDGSITSPLEISDSIDKGLKDSLINMVESKGGERGIDSREYLELIEDIQSFDGSGFFQDDETSEHKTKVQDFLNDPRNSTTAKLNIANESFTGLSIDVVDNELDTYLGLQDNQDGSKSLVWKSATFEIDASQVEAIRKVGFQIGSLIDSANSNKSWENSSVSAKDVSDMYAFMHSKDVIDAFAGFDLNTPEGRDGFDNQYNDLVQSRLDNAIQRGAKFKFRKQVMDFNQRILDR